MGIPGHLFCDRVTITSYEHCVSDHVNCCSREQAIYEAERMRSHRHDDPLMSVLALSRELRDADVLGMAATDVDRCATQGWVQLFQQGSDGFLIVMFFNAYIQVWDEVLRPAGVTGWVSDVSGGMVRPCVQGVEGTLTGVLLTCLF